MKSYETLIVMNSYANTYEISLMKRYEFLCKYLWMNSKEYNRSHFSYLEWKVVYSWEREIDSIHSCLPISVLKDIFIVQKYTKVTCSMHADR